MELPPASAVLSPAPRLPPHAQGKSSHALWQAWALMEQRQGDQAMVRPLYKRGLEVR